MKIPDEPERNLEINLVPMIDVIFSILAFFNYFDVIFNAIRRLTR